MRRKYLSDSSRDSQDTTGPLSPNVSPWEARTPPSLMPAPIVDRNKAPTPSPPRMIPFVNESIGADEVVLNPTPQSRDTPGATPPPPQPAYEMNQYRRRYSHSEEYIPRPYMFVMNGSEVLPDAISQARMPPYWMLLDHAFAVVFCMCSPRFKERPPLGISQLAWSLELLKTVKSRRGTYAKDVKSLISAIEDRMLNCYAAIGIKLDEAKERIQKATPLTTVAPKGTGKQGWHKGRPMTGTPARGPPRPEPSAPPMSAPPAAPGGEQEQPGAQQGMDAVEDLDYANFYSDLRPEAGPPEQASKDEQMVLMDFDEVVKYSSELRDQEKSVNISSPLHDSDEVDFEEVVREYEAQRDPNERRVLSVTYEEVIARAPRLDDSQKKKSRTGPRRLFANEDEDESDGEAGGKAAAMTPKTAVSRQNLMNFFASWRHEQVERLQVEMQRLNNIEQFMAKLDENFERVLDEETMKKLQDYKPDSGKTRPVTIGDRDKHKRSL